MDVDIETIQKLMDKLIEFVIAYGFQILGALIFLFIGLKVAGWLGRKVFALCTRKKLDETLAKFIGNLVKLVLIGFVAIITLSNFGIDIAPLIALAGASAFGLTLAIQGPLSNYGAGLSIILSRPFIVGNTITVNDVSGVVEEVTLAHTVLVGEDGEKITIPNKQIVGEVIVNSHDYRIVETRIPVAQTTDMEQAITILRACLADHPDIAGDPAPQIGVHDFTYGGTILGLRYWVASKRYYQTRYKVNEELMASLQSQDINLLSVPGLALEAASLSADQEGR
ncbi:mechanosensitive ion channel family protein [Aestuariispira insulae]|uniref:Small-conductance mechanosensitive channel n=1 Tax=Aestuariispira insulae TaxID=1461337 RepID=A0A3D9HXL6_9PROT|nr:mechanosensitive ion channel [Aestuariispira insulae]RED54159.1 small conductance mechanosensitive channel [Aestuariispira insulae]